jgi:chromatin assembly factor 1 subunit B
MIDLPYKMIFAIGTIDSLYIYDTQSIVPRYAITNIHYQALTDLAWNGCSMLAASSADGYVSFFLFEKNELGIPEDPINLPEELKIYVENYLNIDINKNIFQGANGKN